MKVFLNMVVNAPSGYGYYCEAYKRILKKLAEEGKIELKMAYMYINRSEYEKFLEEEKDYAKDVTTPEKFDISINIGSPDIIIHPSHMNAYAKVDTIATVFESPVWPRTWIFPLKGADQLFVPSPFNAKSLLSLYGINSIVVPHPIEYIKPEPFDEIQEIRNKKSFLFGYVGDTIYRKNIDGLIDAFVSAFKGRTDVGLVIKTYPNKTNVVKTMALDIKKKYNTEYPNIYIIDKRLTRGELAYFYESINAFVTASRGEGFCLPMYESIIHGTPVIVPEHTAIKDYLDVTTFKTKEFVVRPNMLKYPTDKEFIHYVLGTVLYEPDYDDMKSKMWSVFRDPLLYAKKTGTLKRKIEALLSYKNITENFGKLLEVFDKQLNPPQVKNEPEETVQKEE